VSFKASAASVRNLLTSGTTAVSIRCHNLSSVFYM
jgi:hypothetical protein